MSDKTLGRVAFEAYRDQLDGVRPWSDVREPERQVWEATGAAVAMVLRENFLRRGFPCVHPDDELCADCATEDQLAEAIGAPQWPT